jgi:uncharacterized small protein (DUF1192 family)/ribosomal protein L40E
LDRRKERKKNMAFFDKLGDLARNIGDKTSEAIETTKLNSKINGEKAAISDCMRQIGEIYYKKHTSGDLGDPATAELMSAVDGHNQTIADLQTEIERIKAEAAALNQQAVPADISVSPVQKGLICPSCGAANPAGTKFCGECGHRFELPAGL